jgi:hypothetical protein
VRDRLLLTVAYKRARSFTVAMNGLRFLVEYGRYHDRTGASAQPGEFDIEGWAEDAGISRAQAFRLQSAFRTCFPKDDFLTLWRIVRPLLDRSSFKDEHPRAQATFVGTIKATLSEPST